MLKDISYFAVVQSNLDTELRNLGTMLEQLLTVRTRRSDHRGDENGRSITGPIVTLPSPIGRVVDKAPANQPIGARARRR
jgi:hypothetical protein